MTGWLIAGGVLVAAVVAVDAVAVKILRPLPRKPDRTVPETGVEHEDFSIRSGDHELGAFLLCPEGEVKEPLVLLAHGWGANYSLLLQLAEPLVGEGYQVLLFDVRGHGRNEPVPFVTVRHFRDDIMAVVEHMRGRYPDRPMVLIGHSLGGAASVLAAAEGSAVDGLVLIAAPADVIRVTAKYLSDQGLRGDLVATVFLPFWWLRAGSRFGPLTPTLRLPEVEQPVLIVQPEHDHRVPLDNAEALAQAAGEGFHLVLGATHNDVLGNPETRARVTDFLGRF